MNHGGAGSPSLNGAKQSTNPQGQEETLIPVPDLWGSLLPIPAIGLNSPPTPQGRENLLYPFLTDGGACSPSMTNGGACSPSLADGEACFPSINNRGAWLTSLNYGGACSISLTDGRACSPPLTDRGACSPYLTIRGACSPPLTDRGACSPSLTDRGACSPPLTDRGACSPFLKWGQTIHLSRRHPTNTFISSQKTKIYVLGAEWDRPSRVGCLRIRPAFERTEQDKDRTGHGRTSQVEKRTGCFPRL